MADMKLWQRVTCGGGVVWGVSQGAATSVYCCVAPDIRGGAYYDDCAVASPAPYATSEDNAAALWEYSVSVTAGK